MRIRTAAKFTATASALILAAGPAYALTDDKPAAPAAQAAGTRTGDVLPPPDQQLLRGRAMSSRHQAGQDQVERTTTAALTGALFQAAAKIPGLSWWQDAVDAVGRDGVAVARF